MSDLLEEFVFDSREHLSNASSQLLALERDPRSLENLNALLGTLHTIKGNSGFVNQRHLYELLHTAESLLQTVRETADRTCPANVVEVLFQVLDTAEAIMSRLENDEDDDVDWLPTLLEALKEASASLEWGIMANSDQEDPPSAPEAEPVADIYAENNNPGDSDAIAAAQGADLDTASEAAGSSQREHGFAKTDFDPSLPVQTIVLSDGLLAEKGENYIKASEDILDGLQGDSGPACGLILDMRRMTSFTSPEVRFLEKLRDYWGERLKILLSREEQSDFYRMFSVLDQNKVYSFYPEEEEALVALKGTS